MDLKTLAQAVRSGWWLVAIALLVGIGGGGVLTWVATPLYASTTKLFVSTAATSDTASAYQGNLFSQQRVASYAELLTGVQLATQVVADLDLAMTPEQVAGEVTAVAATDTVILTVTVVDPSAQRAQDIATSLGINFAERVTELETPPGSAVSTVKVDTVEVPSLSTTPVSPNRNRNLALGAALGMLLGLTLALFRLRLDNTVKTREDIVELTGSGVIGTVLEDPKLAAEHLVTGLDRQSIAAESYRTIRTNLQFLDVDHPPRTIVFSSAVPGEGKSTLAVNLATVLAQSGSRVMLIEADLRRPRVTKYMGLIGGAGLSNVLGGTATLRDVAQPWADGRLDVLAAGPMPPNPSEMLGSAQMRALLAQLRSTYDYVVLDAPPLLPVTDAAVLAANADGCVLSARYGMTRKEELEEAAAALARVDARLLGVVLNRVPPAAGKARGYGYGYGYQADAGREVSEVARVPGARRAVDSRDDSDMTGQMAAIPPVRAHR